MALQCGLMSDTMCGTARFMVYSFTIWWWYTSAKALLAASKAVHFARVFNHGLSGALVGYFFTTTTTTTTWHQPKEG
jgi:hypothetical protein